MATLEIHTILNLNPWKHWIDRLILVRAQMRRGDEAMRATDGIIGYPPRIYIV